jgi:hypothetical protein
MSMTSLKTPSACDACAEKSVGELVGHIRDEYHELPGLVLTSPQVCRMFGLDRCTCNAVMHEFVAEGLLVRLPNGSYANRRAQMLRQ